MLNTNLKEFEVNVAEQKTGESKKTVPKNTDAISQIDGTPKSHKISNKLDIRGQKLAVISFIKDDADIPEFLFRLYGFFDKEEEINAYIRNVCGDKVHNFDIDVVSTCQWINDPEFPSFTPIQQNDHSLIIQMNISKERTALRILSV